MVPEPGPAGRHQGQPGDQHPEGAALAGLGQAVLEQARQAAEVAKEAGRQGQVDQVARVVAERWGLQQLQGLGQQGASGG
ncbi:MAG TPA: hypothetical protein VL330_21585, partial [Actinomycetes bacterium]|nr:hypothetical protein [Actinomycetes bacterium]